jgi:succinate dehydrogenase hydrophobic anchor subunit
MAEGLIRCPRCGNENRADSFQCSFCGKRLKIEKIEKIEIFRRIEKEWTVPNPWYLNLIYLFLKPNVAFHDINHKRSKAPGYKILFLNSLLWGLMGLAFVAHFKFVNNKGEAIDPYSISLFPYGMGMFLIFFIFGLLLNTLFYFFLIWLFTLGANYSVGFTEKLEERFAGEKEEKFKESQISPFSIYKSGTLLQTQQAFKYKMLMCAFAPFLLTNMIRILIILIAFPNVKITLSSNDFNQDTFVKMINSPIWAVMDIIDAITIAVWIPILMTIAIRELSNSSTQRILISSLIIGIVIAIFVYFMRPTLFGA